MNLKIGTRPLVLTGRNSNQKTAGLSPPPPNLTNAAKPSRKSPFVRDIAKNFPSSHSHSSKVRDFFDNFDGKCQIKYESVQEPNLDAERKLMNQLEVFVSPPQYHQGCQQYELNPDSPPITFNFSSQPHAPPSNKDEYDSLDSRLQRINQRLRKISSLTRLQSPNESTGFKNQQLISRPGFIRISKSFKRRNRSLQSIQGKQHQSHQHANPTLSLSLHSSNSKGVAPQAAPRSLQKLSKIRRELTSIYQQRCLRPQLRLRLP